VAITTLSNERLALTGDAAVSRNLLGPLLRLARGGIPSVRRPPSPRGTPAFRERIASYHAAVAGVEHIAARILDRGFRGAAIPDPRRRSAR